MTNTSKHSELPNMNRTNSILVPSYNHLPYVTSINQKVSSNSKTINNSRTFINENLKTTMLKRRKSKIQQLKNSDIYSNGNNLIPSENNSDKSSQDQIENSVKSHRTKESIQEATEEELLKSNHKNTLSTSKKDVVLGLYTILEEDKSQLNRSRVSDVTKIDSINNEYLKSLDANKKFYQSSESSVQISQKRSKKNSFIFNINIKNDFSIASENKSEEYEEINIYDPNSSSSNSISNKKSSLSEIPK